MKAQVSLLAVSLWIAVVPCAAAAGDLDSVAAAGADDVMHRDRSTGIAVEKAVLRRGRIVIVGTTLLPGQRVVLDFPRVSTRSSRKQGGRARFRISVPAPPGDCSVVLSVGGRRSAPTTIAACAAALNARGEWRRDRSYAAGDLATRDGSTWLAARRSKGIVPGSNRSAWRIFAARGATGPRGRSGAAGPTGAAGMDGATGAQGPAGMDGVNGATGAAGPAGPAGDAGPAGPTGADGAGFRIRGPYDPATTDYLPGDVVVVQGSAFVATTADPPGPPDLPGAGFELLAERGMDGDQGELGPQGLQGVKGDTGDVGPQGSQGAPGVKGDTGDIGTQGPQGVSGVKGDTGDVGPQGDPGVKGDTGDIGPQGLKGAQGDKGDTGDIGPQGPQGIQGAKGDTGDIGPQGLKGAQGDKGDTGDVGPQGPQGAQGAKGDIGDVGPQGPQGAPGVKGDTGDVGPQGPQGAPGVKGDTGDVGAQGPQGIQGAKGDIGDVGPQGPQGAQGMKGDTGDAGPTGPSGTVATLMLYGAPASVPPTVAGGVFQMVSPAATVVVTASQRITGMIAAPAYGTGAPPIFSYAMCWRPEGSLAEPTLILPPGGNATQLATSYGSFRGSHAAAGSTVPGVDGSIEVGLCVRDYSATSGYGTIVVDVQTGFLTVSLD